MGFDILLLVFCGIGFLAGYKRGIIYMLFFVAALFFGTFATLKFNTVTLSFLQGQFGLEGAFMPLVSLILTFVIVFAIILWLSEMLTKLLKMVFLNSINRLVGGALGALAAAALVSIATWYLNGLNVLPMGIADNSNTFKLCMEFAPFAIEKVGKVMPFMADLYEQLETMFDQSLNNK